MDIVSADRSPRPASQTAENITVVTTSEIEALNAHTLADVLHVVAGVDLQRIRTPGAVTSLDLQGSNFNHVLVLIDNVPINSLAENFAEVSAVPVQMIERVEVVKGAASSSWGSALGGVINVITKTPDSERTFGGMVSASYGERETIDGRGEVSGTRGALGYYLSGGKLRSDGLLPNNEVDLNSFYGKLHYDLPVEGSLTLTTGYTGGESGQLAFQRLNMDVDQDLRQLISTLTLQYPLSDRLGLEATLRTRQSKLEIYNFSMADGSTLGQTRTEESASGGSVMLSWLDDLQRVVAGIDYDHVDAHVVQPLIQADLLDRSANRIGIYLNDTFTLGALAVTPSARFDHTGSEGDLFSPSLGVTYAVTENTVLRGYTARGYSLTSLSRSNSTEKVWTSQAGFESADIPYLWLKGTAFRNDTSDINVRVRNPDGSFAFVKQSLLKKGYELEARTVPLFGTSFSVGYTFVNARNEDTGAVVPALARHTLKLGVRYEDKRYLRALLTGHYIDWNAEQAQPDARYSDFIWDLFLGKTLYEAQDRSLELFISVRNLFDDEHYLSPLFKNTGRWGEVGVRCVF